MGLLRRSRLTLAVVALCAPHAAAQPRLTLAATTATERSGLVCPARQPAIADFRIGGEQLFFANALRG